MTSFGELVLVLGDLHIPQRASKIPFPFQRMLVPNRMQHVICTGNLSNSEQLEQLRALAPNFHIVSHDRGSNDGFPETRVLQVGAFRIGVIHGHQLVWHSREALARMRRKLNVDILISGHTHKNDVTITDEGYCFINPGSITGAESALTEHVIPSFVLLAIQDDKVVCYVYELVKGEVEVTKTEFTKKKPEEIAPPAANPALLDSLLK